MIRKGVLPAFLTSCGRHLRHCVPPRTPPPPCSPYAGVFAYWGPKVAKTVYGAPNADLLFGVITIATGVAGTGFGGILLDRLGAGLPTALALCAAASAIGGSLCGFAFAAGVSGPVFWSLVAVGEFFLFSIQAPSNAVTMWASECPLPRLIGCSDHLVAVLHIIPSAARVAALFE